MLLKMRAVGTLLVLLFFMYGAQTQSPQQPESGAAAVTAAGLTAQLDDPAELTRLRDTVERLAGVVVELRVELSVTNNELQHSRGQVVRVEADMTTMRTEMMNLIKDNAAQKAELTVMKTEVENLHEENTELEAGLTVMRAEMENLKQETGAQGGRLTVVKDQLTATETKLENLRNQMEATPKVAFSAGLELDGFREAVGNDMNLVFNNIISNVGQAYSSISGVFIAPVRGVYYFRFTVRDALDNRQMAIRMCKNGMQVMYLYEYDTDGNATYLSSGVTLVLEVGDEVNMKLPEGYRLQENNNNHNIFTGFLLFPL